MPCNRRTLPFAFVMAKCLITRALGWAGAEEEEEEEDTYMWHVGRGKKLEAKKRPTIEMWNLKLKQLQLCAMQFTYVLVRSTHGFEG